MGCRRQRWGRLWRSCAGVERGGSFGVGARVPVGGCPSHPGAAVKGAFGRWDRPVRVSRGPGILDRRVGIGVGLVGVLGLAEGAGSGACRSGGLRRPQGPGEGRPGQLHQESAGGLPQGAAGGVPRPPAALFHAPELDTAWRLKDEVVQQYALCAPREVERLNQEGILHRNSDLTSFS